MNLQYDLTSSVTIDSARIDFLLRWLVVVGRCPLGILPYLFLFLQHALQRLLRLAVRELRQVVVIGCQPEQPLWADLRHRTNEWSRREHKFVEENPLRFAFKTARRVQKYFLITKRKGNNVSGRPHVHTDGSSLEPYLIVLNGEITGSLPLHVRNLHKVPAHERLANVHVVLCLVVV